MRQIPSNDDFLALRRLVVGRAYAVSIFSALSLALGYPVFALAAFLGGMAIIVPELFQYVAVQSLLGSERVAGKCAPAARIIHMLKLLLTVAFAVSAVVVLNAAGTEGANALVGMIVAFAGYLVLARK